MSLSRVTHRVLRLEAAARQRASWADLCAMLVQCMAEAASAVGLPEATVQGLCTAWAQALHALGEDVPPGTDWESVPPRTSDWEGLTSVMTRLLVVGDTLMEAHTVDVAQAQALRRAMGAACRRRLQEQTPC